MIFDDLDDDIQSEDRDLSEEQDEAIRSFAQCFHPNANNLVRFYMERFFGDKMMHCGGKIPKLLLLSDRRVSMVQNYDICMGVDRCYKYLKDYLIDSQSEITYDIKLVTQVLNLLSRSGIPQQYAGGMLCLYLEFVEGVNIGTEF